MHSAIRVEVLGSPGSSANLRRSCATDTSRPSRAATHARACSEEGMKASSSPVLGALSVGFAMCCRLRVGCFDLNGNGAPRTA